MFILAFSYLTTSSFPRFIDLTFQVPMQYFYQQHRTFPSLPDMSAAECPFGLSQPLHQLWSYLYLSSALPQQHVGCIPTRGAHLSASYFLAFCFCPWGKDTGVACQFLLQVDRIYSELSTMTYPSWVSLQCIAHSFSELLKPLCHNKAAIHEEGVQITSLLMLTAVS